MATKRYDRRHDHARDGGSMADRFPKRAADNLTVHAPETFEPAEVLRRSGLRVRNEGRAARQDAAAVGDALSRLGAGDLSGAAGNAVLIVLGGLLGLIMIDLLLSSRGSTIASKAVRWTGQAINRLVSPVDPLTTAPGQTAPRPAATPTKTTTTTGAPGTTGPTK